MDLPENGPLSLSAALIDEILFAMEDQVSNAVLDLESGRVITLDVEDPESDGTLLPLPGWSSLDGFQTMRTFVQELHDPLLRTELNAILDSGQGVFRAFKETLKAHGNSYRRWLVYKRRVMEARLHSWAKEWAGQVEFSPGYEVSCEDFSLELGASASLLAEFRRAFWEEIGLSPVVWGEPEHEGGQNGDLSWSVRGPEGSVGVIWARYIDFSGFPYLKLLCWYVLPDFRGLGLGRLLWTSLKAEATKRGRALLSRLPQSFPWISDFLARRGGKYLGAFFQF
jgi:GNAT superfamily N-acetyltransferase